jgi:hypothetical protein
VHSHRRNPQASPTGTEGDQTITSVLVCRDAPCNEIKQGYFEFKRLKIYKDLKISIYFILVILYTSLKHS